MAFATALQRGRVQSELQLSRGEGLACSRSHAQPRPRLVIDPVGELPATVDLHGASAEFSPAFRAVWRSPEFMFVHLELVLLACALRQQTQSVVGALDAKEVAGRGRSIVTVQRMLGWQLHDIAQPALLELVGRCIHERAIRLFVPTMEPAHAAIEQAQMAPAVGPTQHRGDALGHLAAAPIRPAACQPHAATN